MLFNSIAQLACVALAVGKVQPKANDSPEGASYVAEFSDKLSGDVKFTGASNGSVSVEVDLSGFPSVGGPFSYHVHTAPVPSDGNCTGTEGHLDPYGGNPKANNTDELEVGDLSGRHGTLTSGEGSVEYADQYISLNSGSDAFIGGRSITVHLANGTRYACANITESDKGDSGASSGNSSNGSVTPEDAGVVNYPHLFTAAFAAAGAALLI